MRIVVATMHQAIRGGAEKYLQVLLPELKRRGHQVAVVYEQQAGANEERIHPEGMLATQASAEWFNSWKPEVVFVHGLESIAWEEMLLREFPCVLYAHNYYGTCATGTKSHRWPQPVVCESLFGPACLAMNYLRRCGGLNPKKLWEQYQLQKQRLMLLPQYRVVLVASRYMQEEFARHRVYQTHCLPYPLTDSMPDSHPPAVRSFSHIVLMVARLTPLKGGHYLIPALELAQKELGRTLKLVVAGDGPEQATWEQLAKKCGIQAKFLGWISGERRNEWMRRADLLAVPSLWPEPFGLTGIEAGCVGLPAVAFAVGGIPEWLQSGLSGELAPGNPPAVEGLATAIVKALHSADHWQKLREGAWQVSQGYRMSAHIEQLEVVFQNAIQSK